MNILVVDDSAAMRMMIIRTLRQAGFDGHDINQAPDGQAGLEMIRGESPDLVLADWNMPNMTGIELLEAVREDGNEVTFGFITTEGTKEMRERAKASGAKFLIVKPFTVDSFEEALGSILS